MGTFKSLKSTTEQYRNAIAATKTKQKSAEVYVKNMQTFDLPVALADNDEDKIKQHRHIKAWSDSTAVKGYINYLKGLTVLALNEPKEASYCFMFVKDTCGKTVLAELSMQRLLEMERLEKSKRGDTLE